MHERIELMARALPKHCYFTDWCAARLQDLFLLLCHLLGFASHREIKEMQIILTLESEKIVRVMK